MLAQALWLDMGVGPIGRDRNRGLDDLAQLLGLTRAIIEMDGASVDRGSCHWHLFVVHLLFGRRHMSEEALHQQLDRHMECQQRSPTG